MKNPSTLFIIAALTIVLLSVWMLFGEPPVEDFTGTGTVLIETTTVTNAATSPIQVISPSIGN